METSDDDELRDFKELIERSSFGTPAAKAYRASTPPEVRAEILIGLIADLSGLTLRQIADHICAEDEPGPQQV